jgi:hypothetical protein
VEVNKNTFWSRNLKTLSSQKGHFIHGVSCEKVMLLNSCITSQRYHAQRSNVSLKGQKVKNNGDVPKYPALS